MATLIEVDMGWKQEASCVFFWSGSVRQERGIADVVGSGPLEEGGRECEGPRRRASLLLHIKHDSAGNMATLSAW